MVKENKPRQPDARKSGEVSTLRQRAEEILLKLSHPPDSIPPQEAHLLLHELQVHQIELEMQNDELRRAQLELEASREKFFDLYDLAPVGYFSLDEKGFIREANLTSASMLGIERKQLVGKPLTRFIYREDQDLYYLFRKQLVEPPMQQVCEMRMAKRDGTPFWVRLDINTARGVDGTAGTRVVIVDISESKVLDDALKKSEKRYRLLFENMSEGSASCQMLYDSEGNPTDFVFHDVNPAFGRLTGLHDVVGRKGTEVIPGIKEAHPEVFEICSRVASTGCPEKFEIEFKPLAAWFSVSVYSKKKNYFVAVFDKITERKQAEIRQALSAEILTILNDPPALDHAITRILSAIRRETGFDAVGLRLQSGEDFPYFAQEGFSNDFLLAENTLAVRSPDGGICRNSRGEVDLECTCGLVISGQTDPTNPLFTPMGTFWTNESFGLLDLPAEEDPRLHPRNKCIHEGFHSVALIPLRAESRIMGILQLNDRRPNRFTPGLIVFFENLGAVIGIAFSRMQAENELFKAKEVSDVLNLELAAVNMDLEAFSYSVSHDLRAPLRHIMGYAALLKERLEGRLDEKNLLFLASIFRVAKRMETMIDDLLVFSHSGRKEMQKKRVRLGDLVSEAVREIHDEVSERDITWTIDELPNVNGDPSLLRLVIVNLISNAVKFTKNRPKTEIEISCGESDSEIVCYIKDNGAGFDMRHADRLFGVFHRLHTLEEFEGTGIGLANVRRIVSRHGGRTWAEGSVGQGATFYFTLPRLN